MVSTQACPICCLCVCVCVCVCVCRGGLFQCECFDAEAVKTAHGYQGVSLPPFHFLKGSLPLSLSLALSICLSLSFPLSLLSLSLSLYRSGCSLCLLSALCPIETPGLCVNTL